MRILAGILGALIILIQYPLWLGRGGWMDWREARFYMACFGLLCLLAVLTYWEPAVGLTAFAVSAGCGPVFWRVLV